MPTKVIHIRDWDKTNPEHIYAGRAGKGQSGDFGNPIAKGKVCMVCNVLHERAGETLDCFEHWFNTRLNDQSDPSYKLAIDSLKDKTLVCFCKPKAGFQGQLMCHAQIIAAYLDSCEPKDIP